MKILFYVYYKNSLSAKKKNNRIFQLKYRKEQFEKSSVQIKAIHIKTLKSADTLYMPSTF